MRHARTAITRHACPKLQCMLYLVLQLCKNLLEKIIKVLLRLYVVYHN